MPTPALAHTTLCSQTTFVPQHLSADTAPCVTPSLVSQQSLPPRHSLTHSVFALQHPVSHTTLCPHTTLGSKSPCALHHFLFQHHVVSHTTFVPHQALYPHHSLSQTTLCPTPPFVPHTTLSFTTLEALYHTTLCPHSTLCSTSPFALHRPLSHTTLCPTPLLV